MHTPHNNVLNNAKSPSNSQNAPNGGTAGDAAGLEDDGGGDGEPANPADKPQYTKSLLNNATPNAQSNPDATNGSLLIPASNSGPAPGAGLAAGQQIKSPKSPRPQISVEITPATPKSGITASSTFNSFPPSEATPASQVGQPHATSSSAAPIPSNMKPNPSKSPQAQMRGAQPVSGPSSPHEAVQNWVQSQATSPTSPVRPNAPNAHGSHSSSSPHKPTPTKRNSMPTADARGRRASNASQRSEHAVPRPPSAAGSISGGEGPGKFSLRELLSSGPKLSRKNSASSKKSVSSAGGGGGGGIMGIGGGGKSASKAGSNKGSKAGSAKGSTAGDSVLESKYGIYGKMTVGKGATSVVRLAHKWDRTEEKLYAVKVRARFSFRPPFLLAVALGRGAVMASRHWWIQPMWRPAAVSCHLVILAAGAQP